MAYATASYCRSYPRYWQCRITDSLADVQAALGAREEGWETHLPSAQAMLACLQIERGELQAAEETLKIAEDENTHENMGYPWVLDARGRLHVARDRPREALVDFLSAGGLLLEKLSMPGPGIFPWRSGAALAAHATGQLDQALELAREDLALSRKVGAPGMIGRALRTLGLITGGSDGLELLRQATDSLVRSQARLEQVRALLDLGGALRRAGHRSDARDPLRRGLALAENGGASALRERARVELAAAGARPRKLLRTGRDALTPSELRVAMMAADGLKNREIAQSLFVTTKAVEAHLHHSYQKLDISSRAELHDAIS
jgi:DNA-binding CsgD family transcriptional regulator